EKHKLPRRCGRHVPHATPAVSTRTSASMIPRRRIHATPRTKSARDIPPVACRGAVLRRACRMSERGTTGTANRQHPFIRAGGGRWQGSPWRLPAGGTARGKFGLAEKIASATVCPYPPTSEVIPQPCGFPCCHRLDLSAPVCQYRPRQYGQDVGHGRGGQGRGHSIGSRQSRCRKQNNRGCMRTAAGCICALPMAARSNGFTDTSPPGDCVTWASAPSKFSSSLRHASARERRASYASMVLTPSPTSTRNAPPPRSQQPQR